MIRMTPIATLVILLAIPASAQETAEPLQQEGETIVSETDTALVDETADDALVSSSGRRIRDDFSRLLREHPPELATILLLDPTLLSNEAFLAGYPDLARFVATHPEVRQNPRFYLGEFRVPGSDDVLGRIMEPIVIFMSMLLVTLAFAWLIRVVIEQRRWSRLSRTQVEVHTRLLERFGTSEELLQYMKTPAGARFLESAPIPVREEEAPSLPMRRVLWSIQIGVVVAAGALGMLLVSGRFDPETASGLYAMGIIGFCIGAGFIASAAISLFVSRKLGMWNGGADSDASARSGLVP